MITNNKNILRIIDKLESNGFEAYFVGGCVRDHLMGKTPSDYDITTNAYPEEIMEVFKDERVVPTGIKHGTVTVVSGGENIEITTYRTERGYSDNRHPDKVDFTRRIEDDLSRRDFTINAIAVDQRGNIVDLYDGQRHIKDKKIVCVGSPDTRFNEDALRIMRAVRFSSVLGFEIDNKCKESIYKNYKLLKNISAERIFSELKKLFMGDNCASVIKDFSILLDLVFGEKLDYSQVVKAIDNSDKNIYLRLSLVYYNTDEAGVVSSLKRLKADNATIKNVTTIISMAKNLSPHSAQIKRLISQGGFELFYLAVKCYEFFGGTDTIIIEEEAERIKKSNACISLGQLKIDGSDLKKLGYEGEKIGIILNKLLNVVIEEKIINDREKLFEYVKSCKQ